MQVTLHGWLSLFATVTCLAVAAYLSRLEERPGTRALVAFTLAAAIWTAGNALQTASTTLAWKVLSVHVQYVAVAAVPVTWFAFAADYTGQRRWLQRRPLALVAAPLVLLVLAEWTNAAHHLVRTETGLMRFGGVVYLDRTFGPLFWAGSMYANLVLGAGTLLLLRAMVRTRRVYRLQVIALLGATSVPWVANVAYVNGAILIEPEVFYAVTAVGFAFAATRYQLFDLTPVARSTVLDELPDPVFVLDHTDRIVDANAAAAALACDDEPDLLGERFADVLPAHADDVLADPSQELVFDGDGDAQHFAPQVTPISGYDDGRTVVLRDVAKLAASRRDLERRNAQLEHVTDVMSHDLRNPLNVAQGHLDLAAADASEDVAARLERVADAHDRMSDIVDSTLRAARASLGSPDRRDVALRAVAERAWRTAETGDATLDLDCDGVVLHADDDMLVTVLENLFRNAVEHGHASTVAVRATDDGFVVADDGAGFEDADTARVFERGYTTAESGTGLGLAIVQDVADGHDWTVTVAASDAGGAAFEFRNVTTHRRNDASAAKSD